VKWFSQKLKDPNCHQFIGVDEAGDPVGQVRFEIEGDAEVSVSTAVSHRGQGYATAMLCLASTEVIRSTGVKRINAHIRPNNLASQRSFEKAGYQPAGDAIIKDQKSIVMEWVRDCDR
jgi:RimJ/RimL family protein N-acetyltransferase